MKLHDQIRRLLDTQPDLSLVAFGDLSSGLILNSAARQPPPREVLDLMGEKAIETMRLLAAGDPALDAGLSQTQAIRFTEQGAQIFTRASPEAEDVVCAVCEPGADLAPLLAKASGLARRLAGAP